MSLDTKLMADTMRAVAQCLEIIGPFPDAERGKILMALIVMLKPEGITSPIDRIMESLKKEAAS